MPYEPPFPIGHLHTTERRRIRDGNLNCYERDMLAKGEDPWAKFREPEKEPPPKPSTGTRVHGSGRSETEHERQRREWKKLKAEIVESMHSEDRKKYNDPNTPDERRTAIFETYKSRLDQRKSREQADFEKEVAKTADAQDWLQRIKNDPSKAHLPLPADDSKEALLKWYDEMSKPLHRPFYGSAETFTGTFRDLPPQSQPQVPGEFRDIQAEQQERKEIKTQIDQEIRQIAESVDVHPQPKELSISTEDTLQQPKDIPLEVADDISGAIRDAAQGNQFGEGEEKGDTQQSLYLSEMAQKVAETKAEESGAYAQLVRDPVSGHTQIQMLDDSSVPRRVLDRFSWFRWLRTHPKARQASGGGGVVLSLVIAKQALDYEIDGAWKTAGIVFLAAWAVLAFAIYISNIWDKRRPLMIAALILAGLFLWAIWWAYLPPQPTESTSEPSTHAATSNPTPSVAAKDTETSHEVRTPTPNVEERVALDIAPEKLLAFFDKYNDLQAEELVGPYLYKWTKISGNVTAVHYAKDGLVVFLKGRRNGKRKQYDIQANFEEQRWIDRAKVLKRNENITVRGQLMLVSSDFLHLVGCEIVE